MGRSARRPPAARVATVGALVTVVATALAGLGYAQANPQLAAPDLPANLPVAAAARPVERMPAAEPDRGAGAEDGVPAGSAGSKPTPHPAPPAAPSLVAGTPCTAAARACVALGARLAWLLDGGKVARGPVAIQHGDAAEPTPLGTFTVQWKAEQYTSREYLTQMPYSVFFADGGIAFHEGEHDTPSAGCVKLDHENAKAFYYYLQVVQIH
jgi:hypothetical protein